MRQEKWGLRTEIELRRMFPDGPAADDAWTKLRVEAAKAERVTPEEYDTHGIRKNHGDAHETWPVNGGWKVRSKWFVLLPPKEWNGGRRGAEAERVNVLKQTKAMAKALGFPEAEVKTLVVPEQDWK